MKHMISIVVLSFILQCGGWASTGLTSTDTWTEFLQKPTSAGLDVLLSHISFKAEECDWGAAENYEAVPQEIRQALFAKIASANEASLRAGFYVEQCFDGGDLGDFLRAAGQYFDKKPEEFLLEVKHASVSMASYTSMLTMLPLKLVDDLNGQVRAVGRRIQLLDEIDADSFGELKKIGIRALEDQEQSLIKLQLSE